jgi:hypothetical protein
MELALAGRQAGQATYLVGRRSWDGSRILEGQIMMRDQMRYISEGRKDPIAREGIERGSIRRNNTAGAMSRIRQSHSR